MRVQFSQTGSSERILSSSGLPGGGSIWYSVVQCGTMWYSVVQCGEVLSGTVWFNVVQCGKIWYSMGRLYVVQCGTMWGGSVWYNLVQCGVALCGKIWEGSVWYNHVFYRGSTHNQRLQHGMVLLWYIILQLTL